MNKSTIAAGVAGVLVIVKLTTGVEVGSEEQNQIVELTMTAVTTLTILYGVGKALYNKIKKKG